MRSSIWISIWSSSFLNSLLLTRISTAYSGWLFGLSFTVNCVAQNFPELSPCFAASLESALELAIHSFPFSLAGTVRAEKRITNRCEKRLSTLCTLSLLDSVHQWAWLHSCIDLLLSATRIAVFPAACFLFITEYSTRLHGKGWK